MIDRALPEGPERVFPDRATWAASLLWRLLPRLHQRRVRRRFADDLS